MISAVPGSLPHSIRSGQNTDFKPWTLFPQLPVSLNGGLPDMSNMLGYTGMWRDNGKGFWGPLYVVEISDNFTHVMGGHTFKAGLDEMGSKAEAFGGLGLLGTFGFNGEWTGGAGFPNVAHSQGNAFADFLLGVANNSSTGLVGLTKGDAVGRDWEFYGQDTWQATPRLTFIYGLRYMHQTPWRYAQNYGATYFDVARNTYLIPENSNPVTPLPGTPSEAYSLYPFQTTQAAGFPIDYYHSWFGGWAPRLGLAWRPFANGRTVFRGGSGYYYAFNGYGIGPANDGANPPWGGVQSSTGYSTKLPGAPTAPFLPDITFANPFPAGNAGVQAIGNPVVYLTDQNFRNPDTRQWNLSAEHEWSTNFETRLTYAGSLTHHAPWYVGDINIPGVQTPNVPIQDQRPLQPWSNIYDTQYGATQNLNQLQFEVIKRVSHGLQAQVEYAWTKCLTNLGRYGTAYGPQNPSDARADYGNCTTISQHMLVANFLYSLPFGHGQRWLGNSSRALDALVGGWEVAGIPTYRTGAPVTVLFSVPSNFVGWWGGRADSVASNVYAGKQSGSHNITGGVQWFNPAAFAPPSPWQWGNASVGSMFGPGEWNWDITARKLFRITERQRLTFSADFFDAFNHFNLYGLNNTIADTRDGGSPIPTAGKIFSGYGNRVIQLGLKYEF